MYLRVLSINPMNIKQIKLILAIQKAHYHLSKAALELHMSQPNVSKMLLALEDELGVDIFTRSGKRLTGTSEIGEKIIEHAEKTLQSFNEIKSISSNYLKEDEGDFSIATTHTQARYVLPPIIERFRKIFPKVNLHMHQGSPSQIAEMAYQQEVDFTIATEGMDLFSELIMIPCYTWNRSLIFPKNHRFKEFTSKISLKELSKENLLTYVFGFTGRSKLDEAFFQNNLTPKVVFTASDSDVLKTYVRLGLGVGIIASMAYIREGDLDLEIRDASHLFKASTTHIGFKKGIFLKSYMKHFIQLCTPSFSLEKIEEIAKASKQRREDIFLQYTIPKHSIYPE